MAAAKSECDVQDHDDELDRFAPVIASIRLEHLPEFALSLREGRSNTQDIAAGTCGQPPLSCTVIHPPLYGSYHIVYVLRFSDGIQWAFKVPIMGYHDHFDESAARALTTEALTMRMIVRETNIPLPKVFHFDVSLENELHCPFILMEFIDGKSCQDCWFDSTIDQTLLEHRRTRTLKDVAKAMLQLNKFTYSEGGAPLFDEHGRPSGVGPVRISDIDAELARLSIEDSDETPIFRENGPFSDPTTLMLSILDRREPPADAFSQGAHKLLRLFIQWVPHDTPGPQFVLTHPDIDIQNVLVTEEGALAGLIDWDGVAAIPRVLGNECYPSWLTRDWDPAKYYYGLKPDDGREAYLENSPEELAHYRSVYRQFLRSFSSSDDRPELTGRSLLIENLQIAADDPICTLEIMLKIFDELLQARQLAASASALSEVVDCEHGKKSKEERLTETQEEKLTEAPEDSQEGGDEGEKQSDTSEEEELYLYDFVTELVDGEFDEKNLEKVKEGFLALCNKLDTLDEGQPDELAEWQGI